MIRHETVIMFLLCAVALIRIFLFSAAFPLFNNVDEKAHFDTVVKYSHGYLPAFGKMNYEREAADLMIRYASPEFLSKPEYFIGDKFPQPLWNFTDDSTKKTVEKLTQSKIANENHEASSPPIYYAIAGTWYNIGKLLGISGGYLVYWVRFLNLPVYALLMLCAFRFCRFLAPDKHSVRFSVLLLMSVFPQNVFYSINSDVLSPLCFLLALFCLLRMVASDQSFWLHCLAGVLVATTLLVKLSNAPIIIVFVLILLLRTKNLFQERRLADNWPHLLTISAAAALPIALWGAWNYTMLGSLTGTKLKVMSLGWQPKPFMEIWNHPIFTINGASYFLAELTKTFWGGEIFWLGERLASNGVDRLFVIVSLVTVLVGVGSVPFLKEKAFFARLVSHLNILIIALFLLELVFFSIRYDFGGCLYPSQALPFLTSGRLIFAAFVPFLLLLVDGAELLVGKVHHFFAPTAVITLIALICLVSEVWTGLPVFYSTYNFFHL